MTWDETWDVVIIGAGPAGMQAGIAAASEGLKTLVLEKAKVGGQIGQTPRLENSVFANGGLTGPQFAEMMRAQAQRMGVVVEAAEIYRIKPTVSGDVLAFRKDGLHYAARTVVLAMGNRWNDLDIPGMKEGITAGVVKVGPVDCLNVSVEGREVAVFGGGPSAGQAIVELARKARHVHVILRSTFTMPEYLLARIDKLDNVTVWKNQRIQQIEASSLGVGIDLNGREDARIDASYLFSCNGLRPATDWLVGTPGIQLDQNGRIVTRLPSLETSVPNVFAVGDCRAGSTPRVGVAIGDGSMVVTEIWRYFAKNPVCQNCHAILGRPKKVAV